MQKSQVGYGDSADYQQVYQIWCVRCVHNKNIFLNPPRALERRERSRTVKKGKR